MDAGQSRHKVQLVVSDDEVPTVRLKPGMKVQVETVQLIGDNLDEQLKKIGARLCGGSGTCLAIVDIEAMVSNPDPLRK